MKIKISLKLNVTLAVIALLIVSTSVVGIFAAKNIKEMTQKNLDDISEKVDEINTTYSETLVNQSLFDVLENINKSKEHIMSVVASKNLVNGKIENIVVTEISDLAKDLKTDVVTLNQNIQQFNL